jgi:hypothetical protein
MRRLPVAIIGVTCVLGVLHATVVNSSPDDEAYLAWTARQAEAIGTNAYKRGRVGGFFDKETPFEAI